MLHAQHGAQKEKEKENQAKMSFDMVERLALDATEKVCFDVVDAVATVGRQVFGRTRAINRHASFMIDKTRENTKLAQLDGVAMFDSKALKETAESIAAITSSQIPENTESVRGIVSDIKELLKQAQTSEREREEFGKQCEAEMREMKEQLKADYLMKKEKIESQAADKIAEMTGASASLTP